MPGLGGTGRSTPGRIRGSRAGRRAGLVALLVALGGLVLGACGLGGGARTGAGGTGPAAQSSGAQSSGAGQGSRSGRKGSSGGLAVQELTLELAVPAGGDRPALAVPTTIWVGTGPGIGPEPLVVFAPGYLQCVDQYAGLLRSWAEAGFVVAALTFPATSCQASPGEEWTVLWQPAELASVAASLEAASRSGQPGAGVLRGRLSPGLVAVAGHSDGADAAAAAAFNSATRDPLFRAAVVLAGAQLASYGGSWFPSPSPPLFVVQGSADSVNPPSDAQALYDADQSGPKALLWLEGAGHFRPYEGQGPEEQLVAAATTDFLRWALEDDTGALSALEALGQGAGLRLSLGGGLGDPTGQGGS
jgi:dienelactone hydrolase